MSSYPYPKTIGGSLKATYNALDSVDSTLTSTSLNNNYVKTTGGSINCSLAISGSLGLSSTGIQNITGIVSATQYSDTVNLTPTYASNMSFNYNSGMTYYITPTGAITGITITNIPTTQQKTYVFMFIMNTTNNANLITATNVTINSTVVPIYYSTSGTSATNAFIQTLYLVNTSKCLVYTDIIKNKISIIYK